MGSRRDDDGRPSPEEFLRRIALEERLQSRGKLKIFLGYASGVGKSVRMLDEGRRRKQRGQDVVVAATQASDAAQADELLAQFEVIEPRVSEGGEAIDVEAVLRRHPEVVLVDGLAYRNPPGSRNAERWQDVEDVLASGISVITSLNLQFVAERQARVQAIIGRSVRDSVPESFLRTADEIEIVDAPPEYCMNQLAGGSSSQAELARLEGQLSELRELALLLAAEVVDHQLEDYLRRAGIDQVYGTHERILVCITPHSSAAVMIRRGRRQADRFHGELFVVHARQEGLNAGDRAVLEQNLGAARDAGARVETLDGADLVRAILDYALRHGITQIFLGHTRERGLPARLRTSLVERLILAAEGIDVRIFPRQ
jgi:two-component system, OmpR family, sensor histidine kinase KdpD